MKPHDTIGPVANSGISDVLSNMLREVPRVVPPYRIDAGRFLTTYHLFNVVRFATLRGVEHAAEWGYAAVTEKV